MNVEHAPNDPGRLGGRSGAQRGRAISRRSSPRSRPRSRAGRSRSSMSTTARPTAPKPSCAPDGAASLAAADPPCALLRPIGGGAHRRRGGARRRSSSRSTATARTIRPFIPALIARAGAGRAAHRSRRRPARRPQGHRLQEAASRASPTRVRGAVLRDGTRDTGCGLKAFRRDVFLALPYFDGLHRFLPALVRREGYDIGYVDVVDRPRRTACRTTDSGTGCGSAFSICRRVVADPPQEARAGNFGGVNARRSVDAVGGYLHDVFIDAVGLVGPARLHRAGLFTMRFAGAVDRLGTGRPQRHPDRVLDLLDRRRAAAAGLRALSQGSGFIAGQAFGVFVYLRNLHFVLRDRRAGSGCVISWHQAMAAAASSPISSLRRRRGRAAGSPVRRGSVP